ncbi:hypothetical protein GCM10009527_027670 [Actinomadura nitritigenes]
MPVRSRRRAAGCAETEAAPSDQVGVEGELVEDAGGQAAAGYASLKSGPRPRQGDDHEVAGVERRAACGQFEVPRVR